MKRTLKPSNPLALYVVIVAVATGLSLNACSKNEAGGNPPPTLQSTDLQGPAWKLKLSADCTADTAASAEECRGAYGFTVSADGEYQVGPGPDGQLLTGYLKSEEVELLGGKVDKLISSINAQNFFEGEETCSVHETNPSSETQIVEFNLRGRSKRLAKITSTELCYSSQSKEDIEAIHADLKEFVRLYYPVPFPSPCVDAALAVEKLYAPLRGCSVDADCGYVDNTYSAIPDGDLQLVVTDDCSVIPPLVAANRSSLSGKQSELLAAREQARNTCGDRIFRINCESQAGFQADESKAVCRQGVCRKSPSAVIH